MGNASANLSTSLGRLLSALVGALRRRLPPFEALPLAAVARLPQVIIVAYAAKAIRATLAGYAEPPPFRYRHYGSLATTGRQAAIADFGWLRVRGALAWWLWGAAHVAFLVGARN